MTNKTLPRARHTAMPGMVLTLLFMIGCSSSPQPERSMQARVAPETRIEVKTEIPPAETPNHPEQIATAEDDEKNSIFFSLGSSTVNQREKEKLRHIASLLKNDKALYATLSGHAHDNGSRSFNLAVASARVESVSASLKILGVRSRQIKKVVNGEEKPPAACKSSECRRKMRRVKIIVSLAP